MLEPAMSATVAKAMAQYTTIVDEKVETLKAQFKEYQTSNDSEMVYMRQRMKTCYDLLTAVTRNV